MKLTGGPAFPTLADNGHAMNQNEAVQAMYIAYRAGYNRAVKDRKEELRGQHEQR